MSDIDRKFHQDYVTEYVNTTAEEDAREVPSEPQEVQQPPAVRHTEEDAVPVVTENAQVEGDDISVAGDEESTPTVTQQEVAPSKEAAEDFGQNGASVTRSANENAEAEEVSVSENNEQDDDNYGVSPLEALKQAHMNSSHDNNSEQEYTQVVKDNDETYKQVADAETTDLKKSRK